MIIVIQCTDQVGLVAAITAVLAGQQLNIVSMREHVDQANNRFFMRLEITNNGESTVIENELRKVLHPDAQISINPKPLKKIMVMVTKEYHCLADILVRN